MTNDEAVEALGNIEGGDAENAHCEADEILLKFLYANGFEDVADAWNDVEHEAAGSGTPDL
jgi:hypothetical protein